MSEHIELRWIRSDGQEATVVAVPFASPEDAMDAFHRALAAVQPNPTQAHVLTFGPSVPEGYTARCEACGAKFRDAVEWMVVRCA